MQFKPTATSYDNRLTFPSPGKTHMHFTLQGKRFLYCYIRKNACTLMKKVILEAHRYSGYDWNTPFPFPRFAYKIRPWRSLKEFDCIFFIYRDPVDRMASLFVNKFV